MILAPSSRYGTSDVSVVLQMPWGPPPQLSCVEYIGQLPNDMVHPQWPYISLHGTEAYIWIPNKYLEIFLICRRQILSCEGEFCFPFNNNRTYWAEWWVHRNVYVHHYVSTHWFNSLTPGKFVWNFRFVIFKWILVIAGWGISCEIALIGMSLDLTDDQSTLVQVMAWCHQATSHYLSQCWPRSPSPYVIIRPQWVNFITDHVYWICNKPSNQGCDEHRLYR